MTVRAMLLLSDLRGLGDLCVECGVGAGTVATRIPPDRGVGASTVATHDPMRISPDRIWPTPRFNAEITESSEVAEKQRGFGVVGLRRRTAGKISGTRSVKRQGGRRQRKGASLGHRSVAPWQALSRPARIDRRFGVLAEQNRVPAGIGARPIASHTRWPLCRPPGTRYGWRRKA